MYGAQCAQEVEKIRNNHFLGMPEGSNGYEYLDYSWPFAKKNLLKRFYPIEFSGLSKSGTADYLFKFYRIWQILVLLSEKGQKKRVNSRVTTPKIS